jgi:hypothetical protein
MFNTSTTVMGNSCNNCQIDIDDFTDDINLWNLLNISQGTLPNIDFRNVTIPEDFAIYGQYNSDRTYSNFIGTSDTGHEFGDGMGDHKYTFNNVTGNIILEADGTNTYEFNNCSVNLQFEHKNNILTLLFNDSTVTVNDDLINTNIIANSSTITLNSEYASIYARDCTINGLSNSTAISTPGFSALSSVLNVEVSSYNLVLKDSQLNKDIHSINNGTSIHAYIDNCVWNNMQQFISSNTPSTIYTGQWINNSASKADPIVINTANLASADSSHSYVYENNVGTFLPKNYHNTWYEYGCFSIDRNVWNAMYVSYAESFFKPHLITRSYAFPFVDGSDKVVYSFGVCIPPNWHPDCKFFSIGAKTKKINLTVKVPFSHCEDPSGTQWYNDSTGYNPTMTHTYTGTVVTEPIVGATYQLVDFADNILVGPRYVPFSWDKPANVPYDSSVVPPADANNWYFVIEVETVD